MEDAKCPALECRLGVDVVLRSCDGVLIGAHKANLSNYSSGFPMAESISDSSDPVDLTEDAETLQLLMRFAHNQEYPDIFYLGEDMFSKLIAAAGKYLVHPAMAVCKMYIRSIVEKEPIRALGYAVKHGYPDISSLAAPLTVHEKLKTMKNGLGHEGALFAWLQYKVAYMEQLHVLLASVPPPMPGVQLHDYSHCEGFRKYKAATLEDLNTFFAQPNHTRPFSSVFSRPLEECRVVMCRESDKDRWVRKVVTLVDRLPPFSTYMSR